MLIFPSPRVSRVATSSKRFRCAFAGANLERKASVFLVVVVGVVLVLSAHWYNAPVLLGVGGGQQSFKSTRPVGTSLRKNRYMGVVSVAIAVGCLYTGFSSRRLCIYDSTLVVNRELACKIVSLNLTANAYCQVLT